MFGKCFRIFIRVLRGFGPWSHSIGGHPGTMRTVVPVFGGAYHVLMHVHAWVLYDLRWVGMPSCRHRTRLELNRHSSAVQVPPSPDAKPAQVHLLDGERWCSVFHGWFMVVLHVLIVRVRLQIFHGC